MLAVGADPPEGGETRSPSPRFAGGKATLACRAGYAPESAIFPDFGEPTAEASISLQEDVVMALR